MAKVEVVSSEKERKTNYVAIAAVIIFVIIMFFSVINSLFNFTSNIANMDNLSGCYYIDDVLTADVSLCFDGSSVDYTNWGTTVTLNVDKIVAIEAMGIHLATALSLATGLPFVIIRKREYGLEGEKEVYQETGYGSSNLYINDLKAGEKILLIDDVVSTGGTLISVIGALKDIGVDIKGVIATIEKGDGKRVVETETGIPIFSIVKIDVIDGEVVIQSTIED